MILVRLYNGEFFSTEYHNLSDYEEKNPDQKARLPTFEELTTYLKETQAPKGRESILISAKRLVKLLEMEGAYDYIISRECEILHGRAIKYLDQYQELIAKRVKGLYTNES